MKNLIIQSSRQLSNENSAHFHAPYVYGRGIAFGVAVGMSLALAACGVPEQPVSVLEKERSVEQPAALSALKEKSSGSTGAGLSTAGLPSVDRTEEVSRPVRIGPVKRPLVSRQMEARSKRAGKPLADSAYSSQLALASPGSEYYIQPANPQNNENYHHPDDNGFLSVYDKSVSTFSIDVDTGAYANVRRFLNSGQMPQRDAVRAEELINYFSYDYEYPESPQQPFQVNTEIAPTPWNDNTYLLHIGLQAFDAHAEERPASNLVFLVDVSGSMHSQDKLSLLKSGLKLLSKQLGAKDRISIVTYAGSTGVVLKPTEGHKTSTINMALDQLSAGGSTNGAGGIQLAYQMAQQSFIKEGINRIILATDGDFNVGITDFDDLKQMVEERRKTGISLTTLGFGTGNYNDHLMEQLADVGNGNYSYIDNLNEARKVLVEEMDSTLNTLAHDVKIQVEFNPQQVSEYRLIGYENRALKREDFNNDKVDAGDIGENHSVTAIYEITLAGSAGQQLGDMRYERASAIQKQDSFGHELAYLRLRYKPENSSRSRLIEKPVLQREINKSLHKSSDNFRFAAAVAAFSQQLRGGKYLHEFNYNDILDLARNSRGEDNTGYRGEFIQLVSLAKSLAK